MAPLARARRPARTWDEARAFMDAYARDLLAGNRQAIAARYDRTGSYLLGNGRKVFMPHYKGCRRTRQQPLSIA